MCATLGLSEGLTGHLDEASAAKLRRSAIRTALRTGPRARARILFAFFDSLTSNGLGPSQERGDETFLEF